MPIRLNIIVAACENNGIGLNGELPWRLKEEMKHFSRMTKATSTEGKKNMVLMGRKTWASIPAKFRPLPGRINLVISSRAKSGSAEFDGSIACSSFEEAMQEAEKRSDELDTVWAIGGSSIYQMAFESRHLHRVYLTKILKNFECDTFLPPFDSEKLKPVLDPAVSSDVQQEGDISYKYEVLEKIA